MRSEITPARLSVPVRTMANLKNEKIGIVGSGLIGKSWAMIFASEGFNVKLYDVDKNQVAKAIEVIIFFNYSPPLTIRHWQ